MTREEMTRIGGLSSALVMEGSDLLASKFGMVEKINEVGEGIFQMEMMQLDRIDLTSGSSIRESGSFMTALRLIVEKDFSDNTTLSYEQNPQILEMCMSVLNNDLPIKFYSQTFGLPDNKEDIWILAGHMVLNFKFAGKLIDDCFFPR